MLIASDILLARAAGILVPVFECPVDLSRSPGSISEGSPSENRFYRGAGESWRRPQKRTKARINGPRPGGLVLEPSLGEKAPGVSDSLSCKHPSISHFEVEIGQGHTPTPSHFRTLKVD